MKPLCQLEFSRTDRDSTLESGLECEWLETNGLGDYASSTLHLCPTRRYHGLLVARPEASEKRHVFLSRFEELLRLGDRAFELSVTRYDGEPHVRAGETPASFELAPSPRTVFELDDVVLTREIMIVQGERTVLCRYSAESKSKGLALELRPVLPFREADALTVRNDVLNTEGVRQDDALRFQPYEALPALHVTCSGAFEFESDPRWSEGIQLDLERARGYPDREDHFSPGILRIPLDRAVVLAASIDGPVAEPGALWEHEASERSGRLQVARSENVLEAAARISYAADDFLMRINGRLGVDAGYPWFTEWGRDTFISLPGLTLARGRLKTCEEVLSQSVEFLSNGLLPNIFGLTRATSHYGSVDASLWFARAVLLYDRAGGSRERLKEEYLPALLEIANAYWSGTGLGIRADEGGLIRAGSRDLNATWMDARASAGPVTPRHGCAVEINALWYSLLRHVELLLEAQGDQAQARTWTERRRLAQKTFIERFWLSDLNYLADVWTPDAVDTAVRPNMVLAAALELSPLSEAQREAVVERAREDLVTPQGLRTLASGSPDYCPRFEGGPESRDNAYHQGTVWPWLFGFYVEAALRCLGTRRPVLDPLETVWKEIAREIDRAGLNHISEVFDADAPRRPGGTIAQAWNTAEMLRARAMLDRGQP